jgi:hypothetical protein
MTYELPEWSKQDDLDKIVPSEVRKALQAAHAAGRKEALEDAEKELLKSFGMYVAVEVIRSMK